LRSNVAQLQASDFGVAFGIMMLEIELEQSNHLSAMAAKLSELSGIATNAIDCVGPDFTYLEITGHLSPENTYYSSPLPEVSNEHDYDEPLEERLKVM